jgi:predicted dehydrogenase
MKPLRTGILGCGGFARRHAQFHFTAETLARTETITSEKNVHLAELQDLLTAIRTDGPTRTSMREGAKSLDMALAATQSAETHKEVSLAEPFAFR